MEVIQKLKVPIIVLLVVFIAGSVLLKTMKNTSGKPQKIEMKVHKGDEPDTGVDLSKITAGNYYVYHKGKAYPICFNVQANVTKRAENSTNATRLIMMDAKTYKTVPTLYLGDKDKLIYRSNTTPINTIYYERYKDEGYSFGIYGVTEQANKTYTINLSSESSSSDKSNVRPNSSAQAIATALNNSKTTYTFDSIGKDKSAVKVKPDILSIGGFVKSDVLVSDPKAGETAPEDRAYPVNIYSGTECHTFDVKSDTHYFSGMELYAEYTKGLKANSVYQELKLPDYLPDGYYVPNFGGVFRLVHGTKYEDKAENFNKRQLSVNATYDSATNQATESPIGETACYSTVPALNSYSTKDPNAFGYARTEENAEETEEESQTITAENSDKVFDVDLKKGKKYKIKVTVPNGDGSVTMKNPISGLTFEQTPNDDGSVTFSATVTGDGKENSIIVKGFSGDVTATLNGTSLEESKTKGRTSESSQSDNEESSQGDNESNDKEEGGQE